MSGLDDIAYSRDATVAAVRDYYAFLTDMYLDEAEVLEPPTEDLTAEPDEEPAADPGAISAEAQGEMEALGASGGGEYAGGGGGGGGEG